jgi:hypothetical protein
VRLSRANATTLYALVEKEGVLNTTVTLTGSSQIALARLRGRANTDVARGDPAAPQYNPGGDPVSLTPQGPPQGQYASQPYGQPQYAQPQYAQPRYAQPMQRADDGYIYPADGSDTGARYPAPPGSRRVYDAQSYPQQQFYDNRGNAPQYAPPQPQPYYQQRGLFN